MVELAWRCQQESLCARRRDRDDRGCDVFWGGWWFCACEGGNGREGLRVERALQLGKPARRNNRRLDVTKGRADAVR